MTPAALEPVAREICQGQGWGFGNFVGAGAFKETFRVLDAKGAPAALKVYKPSGSLVRAQREIDAMAQCSHPHIAKLFAVGTQTIGKTAYAFCIEEFLPGGTLADAFANSGHFDTPQIRGLIASLADALHHLTERSLVHRDLKPENIMLRADRRTPVIVDFGLVRDLAATSATPTWAAQGPGTPFFAPPEQLSNDKALIDWRADQFSLGVTFSVLALGRHPYATGPQDLPVVIVDRVNNRESPSDAFAADARARKLEPLIRMVAPWPVQRFRRPQDLIAAWA